MSILFVFFGCCLIGESKFDGEIPGPLPDDLLGDASAFNAFFVNFVSICSTSSTASGSPEDPIPSVSLTMGKLGAGSMALSCLLLDCGYLWLWT